MMITRLCQMARSLRYDFGHGFMQPFRGEHFSESVGSATRLHEVFMALHKEVEVLLEYGNG